MSMLLVITKGERQFIVDTLHECINTSEDLEDACEECIELLIELDTIEQEEYEAEYAS